MNYTPLSPPPRAPYQDARPVRHPTPGCQANGCAAPELSDLARRLSDQARSVLNTMEKEEATVMQPTRALWCDQGGHSFSEKDPDVQVLTITGKDSDGKPVEESRTSCGECAVQTRTKLGKSRPNQVTTVPAADA